MMALHFLTPDRTQEESSVAIARLPDYNDEWCITIDSGITTPAFIALAALAASYAAWSAPIVFGVMVTAGYFFKSMFIWLETEVSRAWSGATHRHNDQPCQDRKLAISFMTAAALYFVPSLIAAYAGQRAGGFIRHMIDSDPIVEVPSENSSL